MELLRLFEQCIRNGTPSHIMGLERECLKIKNIRMASQTPLTHTTHIEYNTHMKNIIKELQNGICEVIFIDEYSVEHTISATLSNIHLPERDSYDEDIEDQWSRMGGAFGGGRSLGTPTKYSVTLFNVAKEEWQTIQYNSILEIERLTGHGAPNNEKKLKASEEYLKGLLLEEF